MKLSDIKEENLLLIVGEAKQIMSRYLYNPEMFHYWKDIKDEAESERRLRSEGKKDND